jgi:hypothetical protein
MKELVHSRMTCGSGVGDGTIELPAAYTYLTASCPRAGWTPATQRAVRQLEQDLRAFEASGGTVLP